MEVVGVGVGLQGQRVDFQLLQQSSFSHIVVPHLAAHQFPH